MRQLKLCAAALAAFTLGGCAGGNTSDLKVYINEVKERPKGSIEPLPPVRTFEPFIYGATALRSPFDEPIVVAGLDPSAAGDPNLKPDLLRPRDFLESFNLDSLSMVGTLEQGDGLWALVRDPNGGIHRVTIGNYVGKNHGKIVAASPTQINLVEIVANGLNGWQQRPRTIKLSEKD